MHVHRSATPVPDLNLPPALSPPSDNSTANEAEGSFVQPLGPHPWLLGVILFALMAVVGTDAVWSADVGAQLYQATALTDGPGWTIPHPFPAADPSGHFFPIHLSSFAQAVDPDQVDSTTGYVVFHKHTVFTVIVAGLNHVGGFRAVVGLSVASTVAASIATARLAGLLDRRAAVPALWISGLASPLFFDGYLGYAHTLGAALVAWGALFLLRFVSTPRRRGHLRVRPLLAAALLLGSAPLMRTEAPLAGIALGLALACVAGALALNKTSERTGGPVAYGAAAGVALLSTAAGLVLDRRLAIAVSGSAERNDPLAQWGFVDGRIEALVRTWLLPGGDGGIGLLVVIAFALVVGAAIVARLAPAADGSLNIRLIRLLLVGAACAMTARLVVAPPSTIPGLLLAFPLLVAGLVLMRRNDLLDPRNASLTIGFALFCGAVLTTQYPVGGTAEWGGRYFAVGLPLGVAIATTGLVRFAHTVTSRHRYQLVALVGVVVVLTSTMAVMTLRETRQKTGQLVADIEAALVPAGDADGRPVVVTTAQPASRWAWSTVDQGRWLRTENRDLSEVGERLTDLDVDRLTLVSWDAEADLALLDPWYEVDDGAAVISDWGANRIFVLRAVDDIDE